VSYIASLAGGQGRFNAGQIDAGWTGANGRTALGGVEGLVQMTAKSLLSAGFFLQLPKNMAITIETTASVAMRITSIIGGALNHTRAFLSNPRSGG
jgi:hypothetical protein